MKDQGILSYVGTRAARRLPALLLCAFAVLLVLPSIAAADYLKRGTRTAANFFAPRAVAVEQATGNVFVADAGTDWVEVLPPKGTELDFPMSRLGGPGVLDEPRAIAIRETGGETQVYVADAGNNRIVRFLSDGAPKPTFTIDPTYTSPPRGFGEDQIVNFASPIALAPNGDLWVADTGAGVVKRFDPEGNHVAGSNIDGSTTPDGAFTGLRSIAVNSEGDLYVVDANGNIEKQVGTSRVVRLSAAGVHKATLSPVGPRNRPGEVAVNPDDDSVVISTESDAPRITGSPGIRFFDSSDTPGQELSLESKQSAIRGFAFRPGAKDLLYVAQGPGEYFGITVGTPGVAIFEESSPPSATIIAPTDISATGAKVSGGVEPNGKPTGWKVEYKQVGAAFWSAIPKQSAGEGVGNVPVEGVLSGLKPGTKYTVRVHASSSDGVATSPELTFTTLTAGPRIVRQSATATADSATLRARVNPMGEETSYYFEYGPTDSYGSETAPKSIPGNMEPPVVTAEVTGLDPDTTYHFRLVATNSKGKAEGDDATFTTEAAGENCPNAAYRTGDQAHLTDCRAYELVTPTESNADVRIAGGPATPDGSVVCYNVEHRLLDADPNGIKTADDGFCATRGSEGWKSTWVTGPAPDIRISAMGSNVYYLSPDGERVVFASDGNLLGRDFWAPVGGTFSSIMSAYLWEAGETHWVAPPPPPLGEPPQYEREGVNRGGGSPGSGASRRPVATSEDMRTILFESDLNLIQADTNNAVDVYEWHDGELRIVSRDKSGKAKGGRVMLHNNEQVEAPKHTISADGKRVFFYHEGPLDGLPAPQGVGSVYMREGSKLVLASPRRGTGPNADVIFSGVSADGGVVFLETTQQLTPQPKEDGNAIYRYDVAEDEIELLGDAAGGVEYLGSSADASTVVYREKTGNALVVTREGVDQVLGRHGALDTQQIFFRAANPRPERRALRISADGRVVVFVASGDFPGGSPALAQVFRWEAGDGIENISAPPSGGPITANASIGAYPHILPGDPREEFLHNHRAKTLEGRVMSDDGRRVFFETTQALVDRDTNGLTDVYEWHDGEINLVSPGKGGKALYHESSADGRTVFFQTFDRLLPEVDRNAQRDIYVAEPNGGFAPPPAPPSCEGDACQPRLEAPAPTPTRSSQGEGKLPPAPKLAVGKRQVARLAAKGKMTVTVRVFSPGRVTARLRGKVGGRQRIVAQARKAASQAGKVKLTLRLSRAARRQLAAKGRLRLTLTVDQAGQSVRKGVVLRG